MTRNENLNHPRFKSLTLCHLCSSLRLSRSIHLINRFPSKSNQRICSTRTALVFPIKFLFKVCCWLNLHSTWRFLPKYTLSRIWLESTQQFKHLILWGKCVLLRLFSVYLCALANRMLSVNWIYHKNHAKSQFSASFSRSLPVPIFNRYIVCLFWWEFICWRHSNDKKEMIQIADSAKTADNCAKNAIKWQWRVKTMNDMSLVCCSATFAFIPAISQYRRIKHFVNMLLLSLMLFSFSFQCVYFVISKHTTDKCRYQMVHVTQKWL